MRDGDRSDDGWPKWTGDALRQLNDLCGEAPRDAGGAWEEDLHRCLHPGSYPGRASDDKWSCPAAELAIQNQERHPAEMVSMQMAQEDPADLRWVNTSSLHRNQGRGAAVNEEAIVPPMQQKAGLETSAT